MPDAAASSAVDLGPSRAKKIIFIGGGVALVGVVAVIALKLIFTQPGAAACDNLEQLPDGDRVVRQLENYVASHVVEEHLVGTERHEVSGCRAAIQALDATMGHGPFTRMTDCLAKAKTADAASRCI